MSASNGFCPSTNSIAGAVAALPLPLKRLELFIGRRLVQHYNIQLVSGDDDDEHGDDHGDDDNNNNKPGECRWQIDSVKMLSMLLLLLLLLQPLMLLPSAFGRRAGRATRRLAALIVSSKQADAADEDVADGDASRVLLMWLAVFQF